MYERDVLLAAVDLPSLADELLGPRKGTNASGTWRCPNPQHSQTGRTPPVSVFRARRGEQRWRCHGCGAGGTAIDLVVAVTGCTVREAFDVVAARVGMQPRDASASPARGPAARHTLDDLATYVDECAARLWRRDGATVRRYLMGERGFTEAVLRVNRIGADPGPSRQARPDGVPRAGLAVVLPVLEEGRPVYAQLRRLRPRAGQPKYLNVSGSLARNPKVAFYEPARITHRAVVVTEGPIDALSAAVAGFRSAAVLGAHSADVETVARLARVNGDLVIAFDADEAGSHGASRLCAMLAECSRQATRVEVPAPATDLNAALVGGRAGFASWLAGAVAKVRTHGAASIPGVA